MRSASNSRGFTGAQRLCAAAHGGLAHQPKTTPRALAHLGQQPRWGERRAFTRPTRLTGRCCGLVCWQRARQQFHAHRAARRGTERTGAAPALSTEPSSAASLASIARSCPGGSCRASSPRSAATASTAADASPATSAATPALAARAPAAASANAACGRTQSCLR